MVIAELLKDISQQLSSVSPSPHIDTRLISAAALNVDTNYFITNKTDEVPDASLNKALKFTRRRLLHEPVAYILNRCEFMSLNFYVDENVLIPRPDTECIVEEIIKTAKSGVKILDIGTGSGCIAVSLAKYIKNSKVTAIDISEKILEIARSNACANNVEKRVKFIKRNILTDIIDEKYDIIVSNPPYIESKDIPLLPPNVRDYEPLPALDGGPDGLKFHDRIIKSSKYNIKKGGYLVMELGHNQYVKVYNMAAEAGGFADIQPIYDLSGIRRGIVCSI